METREIIVTGAAAMLFCATFLAGGRVHPLRTLIRDRRSIISFGAGMCAAYVFVHVMPELSTARSAFANSISIPLPDEGMLIYFLALTGFLTFYGLDHLREQLRDDEIAEEAGPAFRLHIVGFAAYVWLMAYLLVHNLEETVEATGLYALAVTFHFLALDHSLRDEYGPAYQQTGRLVLAGAAILGWLSGLIFAMPLHILALFVAFISGAIIMNSLIMELPSEKDGRFVPFLVGGLFYGSLLVPLG